ncbi:MAG: hypothetical protein ACREX0_19845, partial [Noviherbaspirillum sp.]
AFFALLVRGKAAAYFLFMIPSVAIATSYGIEPFGKRLVIGFCTIVLGLTALENLRLAREARKAPTLEAIEAAYSTRIPRNAVVVGHPIVRLYLQSRPDVDYVSFHYFAERPPWRFPVCEVVRERLTNLAGKRPVVFLTGRGTFHSELLVIDPHAPIASFACFLDLSEDGASVIAVPGKRGHPGLTVEMRTVVL